MIKPKVYNNKYIKSPLNYIGGKFGLLNQILPIFPNDINTFIDLFAGGCNVGINVKANKKIFNDNITYLIDMYQHFKDFDIDSTIFHIENKIEEFSLSQSNEIGFLKFREYYNETKYPLDLFVLIAYSFNHQIRFNNNHKFNNPFGRNRSSFNDRMKFNLENFIYRIKEQNIEFQNKSFEKLNFTSLTDKDFVYCDPPYLITTGTYNDGKRGFKGWSKKEEIELLRILDNLNNHNIKFALSNVIVHKGKENTILKEWLKKRKYHLYILSKNYSNSNYQTKIRDKKATEEVLVTNYIPNSPHQLNIFN